MVVSSSVVVVTNLIAVNMRAAMFEVFTAVPVVTLAVSRWVVKIR